MRKVKLRKNKIDDLKGRKNHIEWWRQEQLKVFKREQLDQYLSKNYIDMLKSFDHWKILKDVKFCFNKKYKTTLGCCWPDEKLIELNPQLLSKKYKKQLDIVIVHEICHLLDWFLHNQSSHGKNWKKLMLQYNQDPTLSIDIDE